MRHYSRVFGLGDMDAFVDLALSCDFNALEGARVVSRDAFAPDAEPKGPSADWAGVLRQFGSGDAICFAVPVLTELMRKGSEFELAYDAFNQLWDEYELHLLSHLSACWLLETLDTFAKSPRSEAEQGWAFAGAFFMKTIQLYESERLCADPVSAQSGARQQPDPDQVRTGPPAGELFEGLEVFDAMRAQFSAVQSDELCYKITQELWKRAHLRETAFSRAISAAERF